MGRVELAPASLRRQAITVQQAAGNEDEADRSVARGQGFGGGFDARLRGDVERGRAGARQGDNPGEAVALIQQRHESGADTAGRADNDGQITGGKGGKRQARWDVLLQAARHQVLDISRMAKLNSRSRPSRKARPPRGNRRAMAGSRTSRPPV